MFDNLISDMDLHYFDKSCEAGISCVFYALNTEIFCSCSWACGWEAVCSPGVFWLAQGEGHTFHTFYVFYFFYFQIVSVTMETCSCLFIDHGDLDTILVGEITGNNRNYHHLNIIEGRLAGALSTVPAGLPAGDDGGGSRAAGVSTQALQASTF